MDRQARGFPLRLTRVILAIFAIQSLSLALWGLVSPRGLFDNYPGGGRHWISALPPFNEHLTRDYAATVLAVGVLLAWAAITMDRRLVQAALVTLAVAALPHAVYHLTTTSHFDALDATASLSGLWLEVVVPVALLALMARGNQWTGNDQSSSLAGNTHAPSRL